MIENINISKQERDKILKDLAREIEETEKTNYVTISEINKILKRHNTYNTKMIIIRNGYEVKKVLVAGKVNNVLSFEAAQEFIRKMIKQQREGIQCE